MRINRQRYPRGRTPQAGIARRFIEWLRPYVSTQLAAYRGISMPSSLREEVLSYVFFILLIAATFIL